MTLKTFEAYQPFCDVDDCGWYIEPGDYEVWFKSAQEAVEIWRDNEGWTDGNTWICPDHIFAPHTYLPDGDDNLGQWCERCRIERDEHDPASTETLDANRAAPAVLGNGEQA